MHRTLLNDGAVDLEGEQIANHLQPRSPGSGLRLVLIGTRHEVQFRLLHQELADDSAVNQGIPLHGKIDSLGSKEGNGNIPRALADFDVMNRISPAPKVNF